MSTFHKQDFMHFLPLNVRGSVVRRGILDIYNHTANTSLTHPQYSQSVVSLAVKQLIVTILTLICCNLLRQTLNFQCCLSLDDSNRCLAQRLGLIRSCSTFFYPHPCPLCNALDSAAAEQSSFSGLKVLRLGREGVIRRWLVTQLQLASHKNKNQREALAV